MSSSLAGRAISPDQLPADLVARLDEGLPAWRQLLKALRRPELVPAWATVDLDRAERELAATVQSAPRGTTAALVEEAGADTLLGARCRAVTWSSDARLLVLEPATEGRLAGALARHGEGWVAVYLLAPSGAEAVADRTALHEHGLRLGPSVSGPFGFEQLVEGGPRDGPYVVVVAPGP